MRSYSLLLTLAVLTRASLCAQTPTEQALLQRIENLEKRLAALEAEHAPAASATTASAVPSAAENLVAPDSTSRGILGLPGATLNVYLDGFYGWNFNRPAGRVNLLRANDTLSDSFTVNQASVILEREPDVSAGRRWGARLDLMFGQNTETLQGGAQNEPRPQVYRNIFQAYGTYVFPVGTGLTVDFGKFASSLGIENNYAFQQMNYSRSYYFNFLPFYHTGVRATYNVSDKLSAQYWVVNGANQTEDFNGFKSQGFIFTIKPSKTVSWNVNYYLGQEGRDLTPAYNPALPTLPTQPGLSVTPLAGPTPNGRTHIFDSYVSWTPAGKFSLAAETDYVVSRQFSTSAPGYVAGGAGYAQYHFTPKFSLSERVEFLKDHGGLFTGGTQDLKEQTTTAAYRFVEGFEMRIEQRRDFSNVPFFLTATPGIVKKEQNTATVGLLWWFGGKRDSW